MSFFGKRSDGSQEKPEPPADGAIPIAAIDLSKWYDLYCRTLGDDILYEDVKILGIRTFERMRQYSSGLIGGYIEVQARDGTRMMISHHQLRMICEHGTQPKYKVLRGRKPGDDQ
jgi:hypothetical protein